MWYARDYTAAVPNAGSFVNAVLRLYTDTLMAMMALPVFRLMLACAALAVVYSLCKTLLAAAKAGIK